MISSEDIIARLPRFLKRYAVRIQASPLGHRLAVGTFWSIVGAVTARGLQMCSSIIIARLLGRDGFGEIGIIQSTVGLFAVFAGAGLGLTATKHVAEYRSTDPEKAGRIVTLSMIAATVGGGVIAFGLFVLSDWLAAYTLAAPHLSGMLKVSSLMLFMGAINGAQTGALSGFEAFRTIAKVNLLSGLASFPIMIAGVLLGGIHGVIYGLTLNSIVLWLLNHIALRVVAKREGVPLVYKGCWSELGILWSFSLPTVLTGAMFGPVTWICSAMLVNQPDGYAEMGIFSAANQWRSAIMFLPMTVRAIALPVLSNLYGTDRKSHYVKVLLLSVLMNSLLALIAAAPIMLMSTSIIGTYGEGFTEGSTVLVLMATVAVINATLNSLGQSIASRGKMWTAFSLNVIWAVTLVIFTWLFKEQGAYGLALANLIAYGMHLLAMIVYAYFSLTSKTFNPLAVKDLDDGLEKRRA